jgi:oligoendopeptidase F
VRAAEEGSAERWDLTSIFPDDAAWDDARGELPRKVEALEAFRGRLGTSPELLRQALDARFDLQKLVARLDAYASMRGDEDTRAAGPQGMRQSLQIAVAEVEAATAWVDPEILAIAPARLAGLLEQEPGLAVYRRYLERLEKLRPHTLDADAERLLGLSERAQAVGATVGPLLLNAEIPWSTVALGDGTELRVDAQGYTRGRTRPDRADRIRVYEAFYRQLQQFKGSLAATVNGSVQEHIFEARARNYDSALAAALTPNEVTPSVYRMLVDEVNKSLPTLHRYLKLRHRMLGLPELAYHDMYVPLVGEVVADYTWERSTRLVKESLAPLGEEYVQRLGRAFDSRWVDVHPRPGKRSGAYVNDSAYDVHPFMLLNHVDDYSSASTLAHEAGHLMHSWYSQEAQPYPTADYVIFVAEVASTVNEVLFFKDLVADAADDRARLALLGQFLEGLRTTVFRQVMFAEFELAIHEMGERGEPLTGDSLNRVYLDLLRRYHGAPEVVAIDELYAAEWAFVAHFHYNFYVYQYATSYVAAIALAEGIERDLPGARERYLDFLRAGSTRPPVELLRTAGVDMTSPEPIRAAMRLMNEVMDRMEAILAR